MASIFARGTRLYAHYRTIGGQWKQKPTPFVVGQETEARGWIKKIDDKIAAAVAAGEREEGPLTVRRYFDKWITWRRDRGVASAKDDESRIRLHALPVVVDGKLSLGDIPLDEFRPRHCRVLVDALNAKVAKREMAPRSVRHVYGVLHTMYQHAVVIDELLSSNPCTLPRSYLPKKRDKDPTWRPTAKFNHDEVERLVSDERIPEECRVLYATLFLTGSRLGEVVALTWENYDPALQPLGKLTVSRSYDFKAKRLKETKTGVYREVPVHPTLAKLLAAWKLGGWAQLMGRQPKPGDSIFPSGKPKLVHGQFRNPNLELKAFKRYCDALEIRRRRLHDGRRTFISLSQDDGADRNVIASLTHPKEGVFESYTTYSWSRLCQEVSKLRLALREGGNVVRLPVAAAVGGGRIGTVDGNDESSPPARDFGPGPAFPASGGETARREPAQFGAILGAGDWGDNKKASNPGGLEAFLSAARAFHSGKH